jgi:hypothetical protein
MGIFSLLSTQGTRKEILGYINNEQVLKRLMHLV